MGLGTDRDGWFRRIVLDTVRALALYAPRVLLDALALAAWAVLLALPFAVLNWPRELYYVALVVGAVAYTIASGDR